MSPATEAAMSRLWGPGAGRVDRDLTETDFEDFKRICTQQTEPSDYPLASEIKQNVPIYTASALTDRLRRTPKDRETVLEEIHQALSVGPGVLVVEGLVDKETIEDAVGVLKVLQKQECKVGWQGSDRTFAFTEKHASQDPTSYAKYYGNDLLAVICEAWLGPGYQVTGTTNSVKGGDVQDIHRDYPLSALGHDRICRFPLINQMAAQLLTLQGAIAHTDMPLESGPTRFGLFTQQFKKGYMVLKDPMYIDYVARSMAQLPLEKGDAVFFNPACLHQPGSNTTSNPRVANLLQVSACWGTPMETTNKLAMAKNVWPVIKRWSRNLKTDADQGTPADRDWKHPLQLEALINATCDDFGYPRDFDTMPDHQPSQAELVRDALAKGLSDEEVYLALDEHATWHRPW